MGTSKLSERMRIQTVTPEERSLKLRETMEKRGYYPVSEFIRDPIRREMSIGRQAKSRVQ